MSDFVLQSLNALRRRYLAHSTPGHKQSRHDNDIIRFFVFEIREICGCIPIMAALKCVKEMPNETT